MSVNILKTLIAIPMLVAAVPALAGEIKAIQGDQALVAALKTAPILSARLQILSAEWRQVETDEQAVAKSNFLTFFSSVPRLLRDAAILESDVRDQRANAALVAEVEANPLLAAHLATISAEWAIVEAAIKEISS